MLKEVIGDMSSPSTVEEVDDLVSGMLEEVIGEMSSLSTAKNAIHGSVEWTEEGSVPNPRIQHLRAVQLLNDAMDKAGDDADT
eukprot:5025997-Pyramimonas_sp.AAC.1